MKLKITSLIIAGIYVSTLLFLSIYFLGNAIYLDLYPSGTSFPSWPFYIFSGLFLVIDIPVIISTILQIVFLKRKEGFTMAAVLNQLLNLAPILIGVIYLILDGLLFKTLFGDIGNSLIAVAIWIMLFTPFIVLLVLYIREHNKKPV